MDFPTPDEPSNATVWAAAAPDAEATGAVRIAGVYRLDQHARQQPGRRPDELFRIFGLIRLGEHDHRRDAGLARQGQVAFQPGRIEVRVAGRNDEHGVHIGRDKLQFPAGPGCAAFEQALAVEQPDRTIGRAIKQQPVADSSARQFIVCGRSG